MPASIARSHSNMMTASPNCQARRYADLRTSATREQLPLQMTGAILCGGRSSRMGRAKAFLPYAGTTLIEHRLTLMQELFAEVVLVANDPEDYCHLSFDVVKDIIPHRGPLVGILSALLVAQYEYTFVIACDMPLVDNKMIRQLSQQRHGSDVVVLAHEAGVEPLLGAYSKRCVQPLEESIFAGTLKAVDFLSGINAKTYTHDDGEPRATNNFPFYFNINTPIDYSQLVTNEL